MVRIIILIFLFSFSLLSRVPAELENDFSFFSIHATDSIEVALKKINNKRQEIEKNFFDSSKENKKIFETYQVLFKKKKRVESFFNIISDFKLKSLGSYDIEGPAFNYTPQEYLSALWYHLEPKVKESFRVEYINPMMDSFERPRMNARLESNQGVYPAYHLIVNQFNNFKKTLNNHNQAFILYELINLQMITKVVIDDIYIENILKENDFEKQKLILLILKNLAERREWLQAQTTLIQSLLNQELKYVSEKVRSMKEEEVLKTLNFLKKVKLNRSSLITSSFSDYTYIYATRYLTKKYTTPWDIKIDKLSTKVKDIKHRAFFVIKLANFINIDGIHETSDKFDFFLRSIIKNLNQSDPMLTLESSTFRSLNIQIESLLKDLTKISSRSETPLIELFNSYNLFSKIDREILVKKLDPPTCEEAIESLI